MFSKKSDTLTPALEDLLNGSSATEDFKAAVKDFEKSPKPIEDKIESNASAPGVKVLRTIMKLIETHNDWQIQSVHVEGRSGCSDFRGELTATLDDGSKKHIDFIWDCAWRAQQEGFKTFWGDPDQQKAAQMFGYQCFEKFEVTN